MASILDTVWGTGPQRLKRRTPGPGVRPPAGGDAGRRGRLTEIKAFGADPGTLRMLTYAPPALGSGRPLVVVLHGCTQDAQGYDGHAGWSALADELGFALLYPEQRRGNNPMNCFNWFLAADSARGLGEVRSIREMVEFLTAKHKIDRGRIFVVGLSAGGAMTANLLAAYPETFAAGAVIAGLPCGAATGVSQAFEAMSRPAARSDAELGDAVRAGAPYAGPWPRVSIWQGLADRTVAPGNADQLVRQWLDVHGAPAEPTSDERTGASRRRIWVMEGRAVVEAVTIDGMGHGAPLGGRPGERAGPYMLDVGVSSTRGIAAFFGLGADAAMTDGAGEKKHDRTEAREPAGAAAEHAIAVATFEGAPAASAKRGRRQADGPREGDAANGALRDDRLQDRASPDSDMRADRSHAGGMPAVASDARGKRGPGPHVDPAAPARSRAGRSSTIPDLRGPSQPSPRLDETASDREPTPPSAGFRTSLDRAREDATREQDGARRFDHGRFGVRATIEKALRAAGLMS